MNFISWINLKEVKTRFSNATLKEQSLILSCKAFSYKILEIQQKKIISGIVNNQTNNTSLVIFY